MTKAKDDLFFAVGKLLNQAPVDEVIPILITASARALILDANGDMAKLARQLGKFNELLLNQITDMINEDLIEAHEATKQ